MNRSINHIPLDETSYNVTLLHQTLEVLGLPVGKKEVDQRRAGADTRKKVRALQKRLNVRVDESILVDAATAAAIGEALEKGGFTAADRSFTVSGAVRAQDAPVNSLQNGSVNQPQEGSVKKQQRLLAFDLDLRGVTVYRTAKTLADIEKNGGFEFLGQTTSDNRGSYSLTFYDWQYRRAERKKADVVVYAVAEDKAGGRIIGVSRLINSEDYSDDGFVRNLDVVVTLTNTRTEYEILMEALNGFLKESETTLREIAASPEQLVFTASELDVKRERLTIAAGAELLVQTKDQSTPLKTGQPRAQTLSHELLYGIGRQDIELDWVVLFRKQEEELRAAIAKSAAERIIREFSEKELSVFLSAVRDNASKQVLNDNTAGDRKTLNAMLSNALPEEAQRLSFLNAVATFKGSDFSEFWSSHLPAQREFKNQPKLISSLLLTQQLALLSGNYQPLINELQVKRNVASTHELFDLEKADWLKIINKTGVPDFVAGESDEEKVSAYADLLQSVLNAAFPTQRIKRMVETNQLPIENEEVATSIAAFLAQAKHFDFATSRVHDFDQEIKDALTAQSAKVGRKPSKAGARAQLTGEAKGEAGGGDPAVEQNFMAVKSELMKIQRVFQVSTTPEAMTVLMTQHLNSAYTIANIPEKSFTKTYGEAVGGEAAAFAIHQRAAHIAMRTEMAATHMMEYSQGLTPGYAMGAEEKAKAMTVLQDQVPNYAALFGSPDLCECEHCRSVYSAAAYFVDLLRFLWRGAPNHDGKTPLDMLAARRPDLLHLPLTCENTNTIIPYIDLANEVMEYYTANDSLNQFKGYDTGETTAEELRANPQNFNLEAYRRLKDTKYPFSLPYHQPLDVIRRYSDHLKVSRYEAMKAVNPLPDATTANAIAAESLRLSEEEYAILTGFEFDGITPDGTSPATPDGTSLEQYYGYSNVGDIESQNLKAVREFLQRSGVAYTALVELVKTQFINPFQGTLEFLQRIFDTSPIGSSQLYAKLVLIKVGTLDPANDPVIVAALDAYNTNQGIPITPSDFALWVTKHFTGFQEVITLFEPNSTCNLDTTELRTIQSIYENSPQSGIVDSYWSKIHRFIRLWRKLGWTIHETDLMLAALGESDITAVAIAKLESVALLQAATKLPLNQLAVLWGNIDTYGDKSLYRKLFLNKAAQQIDDAFKADTSGDYLQDNLELLATHQSAILAAFRISEEDLAAILKVALVIEPPSGASAIGTPRPINIATDALNLGNLSTIYRHVVLAKALKIGVPDLCQLIAVFDATPFSIWDIQLGAFSTVAPNETYEFYQLALSTKEAGFKPTLLEYIMLGTLPADSKIGLPREKSLQAAKAIRDAFAVIDQTHSEVAPSPLTPEIISAKLALSYTPEIVSRFIEILDGTATFEVFTDSNLSIVTTDSSLFSAGHFTDITGLVAQLISAEDGVSDYLWKVFDSASQKVLTHPLSTDAQKQTVLVNELNSILVGGSIYDSNRFGGITLLTETQALLGQNPQGAAEIRLNRLLLEDAYPLKIANSFITEKYAYFRSTGRLTCNGVMNANERVALTSVPNITSHFVDAVVQLYAAPETFISTYFSSVFSDLLEAITKLLDRPAQTTPATFEEKLAYVYEHFLPIVRKKLRRDVVIQQLATLIGLPEEATVLLIEDDIEPMTTALSTAGFSADYFSDNKWQTLNLNRTDSAIDFSWGPNAHDGLAPGVDSFSVSWTAYLAAPKNGDYTLVVDVGAADQHFRLYLDDKHILENNGAVTSWQTLVSLSAGQLHSLRLKFSETTDTAAVRLQWKTATTAPEVVPAAVAYPAAILNQFVADASVYHRAAKFILGFKLTETELNHFIKHNADFANINFKSISVAAWRRIYDYTTLRDSVPQAQALLTDVFALAYTNPPATVVDDLKGALHQATAWDETNLQFLAANFALARADFKNEIALNRLRQVMQLVGKTGLSAQTIATWGAAETDFDTLNSTAQVMKNTVRARYEEKDWLDLAGKLNDTIRENQKQALIAYLLTNTDIQAWGAKDADGLFEYLLIDVQMGACMDTSRIVQANSSVQMFVSRCLLNLESKKSGGFETGVSPSAIDRNRWEWMKNYRVWEANRKVFLYPENWLEPDWRHDRSEFFKDLESYLVQNDITDRSVEQAFRDYLTSLNEVANLEVCGIHKENENGGNTLKYLHVFGRTHNAPYKFFYRRWNAARKWSAWEKMPLDIRCVENGDQSGVHLLPVVWKKRLFLFWPEFIKVQEAPSNTNKVKDAAEQSMSAFKAIPSWEIRLSWSEYVDSKWSPKQVCKEFIKLRPDEWDIVSESGLRWIYVIDANQELQIRAHCLDNRKLLPTDIWRELGSFSLSDITSKVEATAYWMSAPLAHAAGDGWKGYGLSFMNYSKNGKLQLAGDDYLRSQVSHNVLVTPTRADYFQTLRDPFFFSDRRRTYFVRPVDITFLEWIQDPGRFAPFPGLPAKTKSPSEPSIVDDQFPVAKRELSLTAGEPLNVESAAADPGSTASTSSLSFSFGGELSHVESSFGGIEATLSSWTPTVVHDKGLEFHTFYHPFSSQFVKNLNQRGFSGLMQSDTAIPSDDGALFETKYDPNFTNGFVQKPSDFLQRTYYKENVCFDVYGANSIYNWELFFHAPLYIAIRLSKNGKFEEAMKWFHYIFDPTTDDMPTTGESPVSRYWKVLPFKTTLAVGLEDWFRTNLSANADPTKENATIAEWRDNPFDPHLIASNRPLAYMKHVVIKYVENLIAWGDSLFRQFTMESVNEALQIYVIANHILGPRPEFVPKRGEIKAETYDSLKDKLDDFSNALVELENLFPFSSGAPVSQSANGTNLLSIGSALYFCIPPNEKLLDYWDTAADRLFKIRHCQNIDGVEQHLALFSPPIDPAALIQAAAQGLSLGSILADLSSPPPIYRFSFLIQKANEFCADVKALGSALLSAIEKKDGEELSRLRASQETQMLELMTAIKERQVLDAKVGKENLEKARETAAFRLQHYIDLLGNESVSLPASPTLSATLTADSQLPADTNITTLATDVDESLVDSGESGVKLISREKADLDKSAKAMVVGQVATGMEGLSGILHLIPTFKLDFDPFGVGAGTDYGGAHLGSAVSGLAKVPQIMSGILNHEASLAAKMAGYIRRDQDNTLQANLAAREIIALDKQITSADIRVQVTQQELANHKQQIENAKTTEQFLKNKFTNQELYQWMKEQLLAVYKESYNLAYDMAKKAEKAYKYEMGTELASFIQYGYWDNSKQGLVAGDKLQLALRQLEKSYLEENRREFELSKSISLAKLDPLGLIRLRELGECNVTVPEELFDLDFRGHYFRRLKGVRLTIPCVVGPYASVSCSLRLLNNSIRINTTMNGDGAYQHENDQGLPTDDDRFRTNHTPVTAIATSSAQNDSGMFEFNFRDERYLPFERAGVISEWQIELSTDKDLRQFDYSTISDVILHLDYTAREGGGPFKEKATTYLRDFITKNNDLSQQPFIQLFDMKHEFSTEWYRFLHSASSPHKLEFTLGRERFPFLAPEKNIIAAQIQVLAKCTGSHTATLLYNNTTPSTPPQITMASGEYGDLRVASFGVTDLDVSTMMSLEISSADVQELYLVMHYKLG
jgi:hypothetical protein